MRLMLYGSAFTTRGGAQASAYDDLRRLSFLEKGGAAEGTRTPDPIRANFEVGVLDGVG